MEGKYSGQDEQGVRNGRGHLEWPNGDVYTGQFNDGLREGQGLFVYDQKRCRYEGHWKQSMRDGEGVQEWANKDKYDGEWKRDTYHSSVSSADFYMMCMFARVTVPCAGWWLDVCIRLRSGVFQKEEDLLSSFWKLFSFQISRISSLMTRISSTS